MDPYVFSLRDVPLSNPAKKDEVSRFLARHELRLDDALEKYYGVYTDAGLVGGIGFAGKILKCAAVDATYRGEGILNALVSRALTDLHRRGVGNVFVFTKPENRVFFADMGFGEVEQAEKVLLMESARGSFQRYLAALPPPAGVTTAALVMNCNPFTLGHRFLVETAAGECDRVLLFAVEEDASEFPFAVRYRLIREGVADLPNVRVMAGGEYIISAATFPSYFLKSLSIAAHAHAELDATVFGRHIAPAAGIARRYVGEEPGSPLTEMYNATLQALLPGFGVEVKIIPRKCADGTFISASRVRALFAGQGPDAVRDLVPPSTYAFLKSPEANGVLETLKQKAKQSAT